MQNYFFALNDCESIAQMLAVAIEYNQQDDIASFSQQINSLEKYTSLKKQDKIIPSVNAIVEYVDYESTMEYELCFETEQIVGNYQIKNDEIICQSCNQQCSCDCSIVQNKDKPVFNMMKYYPTIETKYTSNNVCDVKYDSRNKTMTFIYDDGNCSEINSTDIYLKDFDLIQKSDFPMHPSIDYKMTSLKNYNCQQYKDVYGHASGNKILNKFIHDSDIKCHTPQQICFVYYDIETYNSTVLGVPSVSDQNSHIGMICMTVKIGDNIRRFAIINGQKKQVTKSVDENIVVIAKENEQQMSAYFFDVLCQFNKGGFVVFLIGFNSNSDMFNTNQNKQSGYDLPFLLLKSQLDLHTISRGIKYQTVDDVCIQQGSMITGIRELPFLYLIDYAWILDSEMMGSQKDQLSNKKLDTYLSYFGISNKLDHDYREMQIIMSKSGSDISEIINYCSYDCDAILALEKRCNYIDIKLAMCNFLMTPISMALFGTKVTNTTQYIQHKLIHDRDQTVQYFKEKGEKSTYMGAYTDNQSVPNQVYRNVMNLDFASEYPNCIIALNIDFLTFRSDYSIDYNSVDVSEENIAGSNQYDKYYYTKDKAILPELMITLFEKRKLAKQSGDKILDQFTKILSNSIYGLLGFQQSPLFYAPLARSVTAHARFATRTLRDIVVSRGHQFLNADTDSCFAVMNLEHNSHDELVKQYQEETKIVNQQLCEILKTDRLQVDNDSGFYESIFFIDGRKSYAGIFRNFNGQTKLTTKGISYSKMNNSARDQCKSNITEYLNSDITSKDYFDKLYVQFQQEIQSMISNKDLTLLQQHAVRTKLTGKSTLCKQLAKYNIEDEFCYVILLQGKSGKSERKIPLQFLTDNQWNRIDQTELLLSKLSPYTKMLLKSEEKIQLKKIFGSSYKHDADELLLQIRNDQILVRCESITKCGYVRSVLSVINIDELAQTMRSNPDKSYHEIIHSKQMRLTFDVDGQIMDDCFDCIDKYIQQYIGYLPKRSILESTGDKKSYHIFYNITVDIEFARFIASQIKTEIDAIDLGIYRINASLRLPNCNKIDRSCKKIIYRKFEVNADFIGDYLMTNKIYHFVQQPLHLSKSINIDQFYQNSQDVITSEKYSDCEKQIKEYLLKNQISGELLQVGNRVDIRVTQCYKCPIHNIKHDRENLFIMINKNQMKLFCYRSSKEERKNEYAIVNSSINNSQEIYQQKKSREINFEKLQDIVKQCNNQQNMLENSLEQFNKYINVNQSIVEKNEVIYIKSALGTGKSQFVSELLDEQNYKSVCILSHRKTFSNDISKRYNCISYDNVSGHINLCSDRYIIQVEALSRTHGIPEVLILDEIESLLTQLSSSMAEKNNAHQQFIRLLQQSKTVIVMDGFLENNTIQMLQNLNGNRPNIILQNTYQPYTEHTIDIKLFQEKNNNKIEIIENLKSLLQNGKKVVSFCTSYKVGQLIHEQFHSDYNVKFYHGQDMTVDENNQIHYMNKNDDLQNIDESWMCDLLIYTSTITAGVNFDKEHFDTFINVFANDTCDAKQFIQGCCRVRKFADKNHQIYLAVDNSTNNTTPHDQIFSGDEAIFNRNINQQLIIWLNARKQNTKAYRQNYVKQLSELGFRLQMQQTNKYDKSQKIVSEIVDNTYSEMLMLPILQSDVDLYSKIQFNKNVLLECELPEDFAGKYNKIFILQSLQMCPITTELSLEQIDDIRNYYKQLIQRNKFNKVASDLELFDKLISEDKMRRLNNNIASKTIDRIRLKKQNEQLILGSKFLDAIKSVEKNNTFESDDIPAVLKSKNWIKEMTNSMILFDYKVEKIGQKKSNGITKYTFEIQKLSL